ncbi:MAG: histone-like nucleoid-structuring protein, MvaT/MvaU family [Halomonas sp.]|nr:histone-like nucleoid-structuring protein, MvaT/MvaU family [Halomonas sp.]
MSLLSEYMKKEQLLKQLNKEIEQLESDPRLKSELEFKKRLESLMDEYAKSSSDIVELLAPTRREPAAPSKAKPPKGDGRRKRKLKIYKNPNTGETVETRGGNHKTLKAWKEEHGADTVESWLVRTED